VIWPPYAVDAIASGVLDERTARQLRANYGAKVSFIDHWLGRLLDVFDRHDRWRDTALVICTDHGHYLGERDVFGKPGVPVYRPMGHIPLLVAWPGRPAGSVDALTTTVDLHATLLDVFGVADAAERPGHGHSLVPLLEGSATSVRAAAITGAWGREVTVTDGISRYTRAPVAENRPLSMWSNRWSTMPIHAFPEILLPPPDDRAWLDRMPHSTIPVIRQPFDPGDRLPFWAGRRGAGQPPVHELYDTDADPDEVENLAGTGREAEAIELLRAALAEVDAPAEQLARLGLG
jgi:hypothetical protein